MGCAGGKQTQSGPKASDGAAAAAAPPAPKKDAERLLDKYTLGKVIGQGAFGVVYSCKRKGTQEEYAVKMVDQVETPLAEIKVEVDMLRKLHHPCIVKLHDVYYEKVFVCIVLEICRGGDMIEGMQLHWKAKGMIPVPVIQNMSKMMFQGVEWLHQHNVVHRDLKGDNYLQDRKEIEHPSCRVFLSDFGTVCELKPGERLRQKCGTKTYWAPEFFSLNYALKVDCWALGVVIFGMVTGRFPFKGEEDVRTKTPKIPSRLGKDGEVFLKGTLERDESKRFSARQAIEQTFLASIKSSAEALEPFDKDFNPEVKEAGANAGVKERRKELVERLENAQARREISTTSTLRYVPKDIESGFKVVDRHAERTLYFEWWGQAKLASAGLLDTKGQVLREEDFVGNIEASTDAIRQMLLNHNIPVENFGKGQAKTLTEFVTEIQKGQTQLMMDASRHRNIVRVVHVVLLRLAHGQGADKKYLTISAEKYPDGRVRADINQLAGTKKMPYENGILAAKRVVRERLNMQDAQVEFNFLDKECFEDEESSPSYPGVRTVYNKEIYEGEVTTTDAKVLERLGLGPRGTGQFNHQDSTSYTRYLAWLTEAQCSARGVRLRAPAEGAEVSPLVNAPVGLDEDALQKFLRESNVDISRFGRDGAKTLAEFSEELVQGEACLIRQKNGSVRRVVDVVLLKVQKENGDTIVEVSEVLPDGTRRASNSFPAVKRREDENLFIAAHRVLKKVLRISENLVEFRTDNVMLVEEERESKAYGGLPTLYRRRIVTARLCEE